MMIEATCVGISAPRQGVARATGKPYDFTSVHFQYADPNTTGIAVKTFAIPTSDFQNMGVVIGCDYRIVSHFYKGADYVDGVFRV